MNKIIKENKKKFKDSWCYYILIALLSLLTIIASYFMGYMRHKTIVDSEKPSTYTNVLVNDRKQAKQTEEITNSNVVSTRMNYTSYGYVPIFEKTYTLEWGSLYEDNVNLYFEENVNYYLFAYSSTTAITCYGFRLSSGNTNYINSATEQLIPQNGVYNNNPIFVKAFTPTNAQSGFKSCHMDTWIYSTSEPSGYNGDITIAIVAEGRSFQYIRDNYVSKTTYNNYVNTHTYTDTQYNTYVADHTHTNTEYSTLYNDYQAKINQYNALLQTYNSIMSNVNSDLPLSNATIKVVGKNSSNVELPLTITDNSDYLTQRNQVLNLKALYTAYDTGVYCDEYVISNGLKIVIEFNEQIQIKKYNLSGQAIDSIFFSFYGTNQGNITFDDINESKEQLSYIVCTKIELQLMVTSINSIGTRDTAYFNMYLSDISSMVNMEIVNNYESQLFNLRQQINTYETRLATYQGKTYEQIYNDGKAQGQQEEYSLMNEVDGVINLPFTFAQDALNFNVLGLNIYGLFISAVMILLIIWVIKHLIFK